MPSRLAWRALRSLVACCSLAGGRPPPRPPIFEGGTRKDLIGARAGQTQGSDPVDRRNRGGVGVSIDVAKVGMKRALCRFVGFGPTPPGRLTASNGSGRCESARRRETLCVDGWKPSRNADDGYRESSRDSIHPIPCFVSSDGRWTIALIDDL